MTENAVRTNRLQRLAVPVTRRFDRGCDPSRDPGCDPSRDIAAAILQAGFASVDLRRYTRPDLLRTPFIAGTAQT